MRNIDNVFTPASCNIPFGVSNTYNILNFAGDVLYLHLTCVSPPSPNLAHTQTLKHLLQRKGELFIGAQPGWVLGLFVGAPQGASSLSRGRHPLSHTTTEPSVT